MAVEREKNKIEFSLFALVFALDSMMGIKLSFCLHQRDFLQGLHFFISKDVKTKIFF
jgi:hypothetical protein